jgi:DNA-binding LacI/PurR family transcriptional regulator
LTDEEAQAGMRRVTSTGLVDAIIVLDVAPDDPRADLARSIETPTIFIGVPTDHDGLVCVDLDFEAAGRMSVDALADAGHRRVGFVGQADVAYEKSNFPPRLRDAAIARAAERDVAIDVRSSGRVVTDPAEARAAAAAMLDNGATALLLHCATEAHAAVLDEIAARGLSVPADVSLVAVGASFDTAAMPVAVDTIPLVPQASCDLAVDLAVRSLGAERPDPDLFLIPPTYLSHSSVARPRA